MTPTQPSGVLAGLRILQLTQRYPPAIGGVERHVERLALELSRAGARVEVATTDLVRDRPFARQVYGSGDPTVPVRRHRAARWIGAPHGLGIAAPGVLTDALRAPVSVLHAHAFGYFPTWAGRLAHDLRGIPLVITPHSYEGNGSPASELYASAVAAATLRRADRTVALTRLEANRLVLLGVDADRIRVIPNGVDLEEFAHPPPPGRDRKAPVVLYVGRIYPEQKGLETLVKAFAFLARSTPAQLRLVGEDWGGLDRLRRLAQDRGISDRVHATGLIPRSAVLAEFAAADVFVLPSNFDAFPFVLLEAMAASLPVVATRVGGVPEIVVEGRTARLVPPGDPAPLADELLGFLTDPALAAQYGAEGRRHVEAYSWSRVVPQYLELYSELARTVPS